jgi:hypothetical protein
MRHAREACGLRGWKDPAALGTLAAACAAAGDYARAVQWQQKALDSPDLPKSDREKFARRLELYKAGKPFRDE